MSYWKEEMKSAMERKKAIYKSPLPRKRQRTTQRKERDGEVRRYSEEEIYLYRMKAFNDKSSFEI